MSKLKCENGNVKVGDLVSIVTDYSRIMGLVMCIAEYLNDDKSILKKYRIAISKSVYLDINSDEIRSIDVYEEDRDKVIQMMSEKYGVSCCDEDGNLKNTMTLIRELMVDNTWDKMDRDDKDAFLTIFNGIDSSAIDGWNGCYHKQNELHQKIKKLTAENENLRKRLIDSNKKKSNTVADEMATALALIGIGGALCAVADNL